MMDFTIDYFLISIIYNMNFTVFSLVYYGIMTIYIKRKAGFHHESRFYRFLIHCKALII